MGDVFQGDIWKDIPLDVLAELYTEIETNDNMVYDDVQDILTDPLLMAPQHLQQLQDPFACNNTQFGLAYRPTPSPPLSLSQQLQAQGGFSSNEPFQPAPIYPTNLPPPSQVCTLKLEQEKITKQVGQLIAQINQYELSQEQQLDSCEKMQKDAVENNKKETLKQIKQSLIQLHSQIEAQIKQLLQINKQVLLEAQELYMTRTLAHKLQLQQIRVEVYHREVSAALEGRNNQLIVALAITTQPIPQVIFKSKPCEEHYEAHLILSPSTKISFLSKLKCVLFAEEKSWKIENPLENNEIEMDFTTKSGIFQKIKVNTSTRMNMVHLKMGVQVGKETGEVLVAESTPSYPFIVITNESQWSEAAGKILLMDAFAGQAEASWPQFANMLHIHFLKSTRQDLHQPVRPMAPYEFEYIHSKFFGGQTIVQQQQATRFWYWFGGICQTLRFKRHINHLWFNGLIYGMITKELCHHYLQNQEVGTFLMRFSESFPGLFAVAYVSDDSDDLVKHYLVKPEDTGSQKTLPDFLREKQQFKVILQLDPQTFVLTRQSKDSAFSSYYSKGKRIPQNNNGYVLL